MVSSFSFSGHLYLCKGQNLGVSICRTQQDKTPLFYEKMLDKPGKFMHNIYET